MSNELIAHIEAENAKVQAWAAEKPGRFVGMVTTDLEHWNSMGVYTVADYERHMAIAAHYDGFKAINGVRPRWIDYDSMTTEEIDAMTVKMYRDEHAREVEAQAERELLVQKLTAEFGVSEETLRRWEVL